MFLFKIITLENYVITNNLELHLKNKLLNFFCQLHEKPNLQNALVKSNEYNRKYYTYCLILPEAKQCQVRRSFFMCVSLHRFNTSAAYWKGVLPILFHSPLTLYWHCEYYDYTNSHPFKPMVRSKNHLNCDLYRYLQLIL